MLIKEAVRQDCPKCGRFEKEISPEEHGCDQCRKLIVAYGNDERLDVSIFHYHSSTEHFYFCSWKCVFKFVRKVNTNQFFRLPYVCADNKIVGRRAKDFMAEIRKMKPCR